MYHNRIYELRKVFINLVISVGREKKGTRNSSHSDSITCLFESRHSGNLRQSVIKRKSSIDRRSFFKSHISFRRKSSGRSFVSNVFRTKRMSSISRKSFLSNVFHAFNHWSQNPESPEESLEQGNRRESESNGLTCFELHNILFQAGILIELDFVFRLFEKADVDGTGILTMEDFCREASEMKTTQDLSCRKLILEVLQLSSFWLALCYTIAGVLLILHTFSEELKFGNTMILVISLSFKVLYGIGAFHGIIAALGNLSSKFHTMQVCRINFCNKMITNASESTRNLIANKKVNL